jgi:hypothetical protein
VSDIDPGACKILAHRYPDLPNHGDITKIDWNAVEPVDILTGGFPCQPFSTPATARALPTSATCGRMSLRRCRHCAPGSECSRTSADTSASASTKSFVTSQSSDTKPAGASCAPLT